MKPTEDTYRHKGMRKKLIDGIRSKGITDEKVLDAIGKIPRHFFLDSAFDEVAYADRAFPIGEGQTISQPYTVAYQTQLLDAIGKIPRHFFLDSAFDEMAYADRAFPIGEGQTISQPYTVAYQTQLLELKPFEKVLEIGTGSAYQACVLAEMGAQLYTIERQKKLFDDNKKFGYLKKYPTIKFFYGDGFEGLPTYGPFDKILITAAAPLIPQKLIEQLKSAAAGKPGGSMVLPLGEGNIQRMIRITKLPNDALKEESFDNFSFVPMMEGRKG